MLVAVLVDAVTVAGFVRRGWYRSRAEVASWAGAAWVASHAAVVTESVDAGPALPGIDDYRRPRCTYFVPHVLPASFHELV